MAGCGNASANLENASVKNRLSERLKVAEVAAIKVIRLKLFAFCLGEHNEGLPQCDRDVYNTVART